MVTNYDGQLERIANAAESLSNNIDTKLSEFLPLSGGTVTGDLTVNGGLVVNGVAVVAGTEATETFSSISVPANGNVNVGTLSHAAKYWSAFVTGSGLASVYVTMSADHKNVYAQNVTSTARTLTFKINYIY